ncbi:unnamed protein product [Ixodes pacificus]
MMAESRILFSFRNTTSYKIGRNILPGLAPRSRELRYVRASICDLSFGTVSCDNRYVLPPLEGCR